MSELQICQVFEIAPLSLSGMGAQRNYPRRLNLAQESVYQSTYDFHTLAYDSFFDSRERQVILVCPKLFNFEYFFKQSCVSIDGVNHRPLVTRCLRHDIVAMKVNEAPKVVEVVVAGQALSSRVSATDRDFFSGFNVLVTLSKNNHLHWVRDWAEHHVTTQGANAVLFIDNGSSAYGIKEVLTALSSIEGLKRIGVVSAPFRYGPVGSAAGKTGAKSRFLQPALLNLVRLRFLQDARAVLLIDIDELVHSLGSRSIFDATVNSLSNYVPIKGRWFDTEPHKAKCARHADHVIPRVDMGRCPPKYCVVPSSFLGNLSWSVHKLEVELAKLIPTSRDFYFSHLIRITDNWKGRLNTK